MTKNGRDFYRRQKRKIEKTRFPLQVSPLSRNEITRNVFFFFPFFSQLKQFKEEKRREEKALGVEEESEEIRKIKKVGEKMNNID